MTGVPGGGFKGTRILMNIGVQPHPYYCPLTVMELEVPTPLATVTATEAILLSTVCPVGNVPAKVNGILNVNWPPNACEAVLSNHTVETGCALMLNCVVGILKPEVVVNCTLQVVSARVVVKPVTAMVRLEAEAPLS